MVRVALEGRPDILRLQADLSARRLDVYHSGDPADVVAALQPLGLGANLLDSADVQELPAETTPPRDADERRTLRLALAINAVMFVGEAVGGYLADSTALIADSLDMFSDAAVYGIALYGVGRGLRGQASAARISGWLQLTLAGGAAFEVVRRAVGGSEPEAGLMMIVAAVALVANAATMKLLSGHREGGAHMQASWIFTTNDVLANLGVIVGGLLVRATGSSWPDLIVGTAIALLVFRGALRILRVAASARQANG